MDTKTAGTPEQRGENTHENTPQDSTRPGALEPWAWPAAEDKQLGTDLKKIQSSGPAK